MGYTFINFWVVGASKPSENVDSMVSCVETAFWASAVPRYAESPMLRPGIGKVPSTLAQFSNHGCLVQSTLHTSRSIRFKLGQKFVAISCTVLLTESVIAIKNFSHNTFLDDCAFSSTPICSATYTLQLLVLSCPKGLIPSLKDLCSHLIVDFRSFMS